MPCPFKPVGRNMDSILTKVSYAVIGITAGIALSVVINDTKAQFVNLQTEQEQYYKDTGEYISDPENGVNTYTTLCKGYFVIDELGSTGYGDLKDDFTYEYEKADIATSTDTKLDTSF